MAQDSGNQSAPFGSRIDQQADRDRSWYRLAGMPKALFLSLGQARPSRQNQLVFNGGDEFPHKYAGSLIDPSDARMIDVHVANVIGSVFIADLHR